MSARLISICLIVALLMVWRGLMPTAKAKPPDLPVNLKVDCAIEGDLIPAEGGSSDIEIGPNGDQSQPEALEVMPTEIEVLEVMPMPATEGIFQDIAPNYFIEGLSAAEQEVIILQTMPGEVEFESDRAATPGRVFGIWSSGGEISISFRDADSVDVGLRCGTEPDSRLEYTCPYLKQKAAEAEAPGHESPGLVNSVLDNLNKLLEAEKLYRRAERCRRHGDTDKACHWYEVVQHLCPGSRYDRLSAKRLKELHAVQDAEAAEMEAEECSATPIPIEAQVAELLEACQRALADGRYGEARDLADRALALDPACVAAKALVIKTHAFSHRHQATETGDGEEASSCDGAEGSQPQTTENHPPAELDIELLFRPADPEHPAECEDDACPGVGTKSMHCGCCTRAGAEMLRRICESLSQGTGLDVDIGATGRVRVRYSSLLGNIECCVGGDMPGSLGVKSAWLRLLDAGAETRSCKPARDAGEEEASDRAGFEPVED